MSELDRREYDDHDERVSRAVSVMRQTVENLFAKNGFVAPDDILAAYGLAMDELGVGPRGYFLPKALSEALDSLLKEFASKNISAHQHQWRSSLGIQLDDGDYAKIGRGSKWEAGVTDQDTGKTYLVRGASCGLPRCYCDAVIAAELKSRLH
jgi:hypothetical protein